MPDLITIDIDLEREAVARLWNAWDKAARAKDRAIAEANATHSSPGPDYWKAEALARARYVAAAHILEVLEGQQ